MSSGQSSGWCWALIFVSSDTHTHSMLSFLIFYWCDLTDLSCSTLIFLVTVLVLIAQTVSLFCTSNYFLPEYETRVKLWLHLSSPLKIDTITNQIKLVQLQPPIDWSLVTNGHHKYHKEYYWPSTFFFAYLWLLLLGLQHYHWWAFVLLMTFL